MKPQDAQPVVGSQPTNGVQTVEVQRDDMCDMQQGTT